MSAIASFTPAPLDRCAPEELAAVQAEVAWLTRIFTQSGAPEELEAAAETLHAHLPAFDQGQDRLRLWVAQLRRNAAAARAARDVRPQDDPGERQAFAAANEPQSPSAP